MLANVFLFHCIEDFGKIWNYQFRVGDIVTVKNWGNRYTYYPTAHDYFKRKLGIPYYNSDDYCDWKPNDLFKIRAIARHHRMENRLLALIEDRNKRGVIINMDGLSLVKQYPLRKDEKLNKNIEIIKY